MQISIARPKLGKSRNVRDIVCTLLHEMCHALFQFACRCFHCRCKLNIMSEEGLTAYGPSWQRIRNAVEVTVTRHLR